MSITPETNHRPTIWNEIGLIEQIGNIIQAYNKIQYPTTPGEHIYFFPAYPDYVYAETGQVTRTDIPTKLICYDLVDKQDGSQGPNRFDKSKQMVRPRIMESYDVTDPISGKTSLEEVYYKHYDIQLRFDCMAPSDVECMQLINTFERMMEIHARYLETGVKRFLYDGRRLSYFNKSTQYKSRTCLFYAQVEEHWYKLADKIDRIQILLGYAGPIA
jgi:hypothetical protein